MIDYDRLLVEETDDQLHARPLDELRAARAECVEVETGLSYLRRLVQGPLDIATREQAGRRSGDGGGDVSSLVHDLPVILADGPSRGDGGRLPLGLAPTAVDPELEAELSGILGDAGVVDLPALDDDALDALIASLREFEAKVSARRRALFARIDTLKAELARRYRTGEASVDSLLQ
jgi:hypothetical protein